MGDDDDSSGDDGAGDDDDTGDDDDMSAPALAIDLGPDYDDQDAAGPVGLAGIPNLDDDNTNQISDWDEGVFGEPPDDFTTAQVDGENDLVSFTIRDVVFDVLQPKDTLRLLLSGDTTKIRIWSEGEVMLGALVGGYIDDAGLESTGEDQVFEVEFRDFLAAGELTLVHLDSEEQTIDSTSVRVTASPLLLNHHLQSTTEVWVVEVDAGPSFNNEQMIEVFEDVLGGSFSAIDGPLYSYDQWIQDEIELGWTTANGVENQWVVDSIRDRPLDAFPEVELLAPDVVIKTWGEPDSATSLDYFGNLEVSPPVTVDDVDYPLGRIYWGGHPDLHPDDELTDFLVSQQVQSPFQVDSTWLCVSHIDEFTSFVPDPASPKGFKFVYANTDLAWQLLEDMDADTPLPRYGVSPPGGHGLSTVGALLNNSALSLLNEEIQEDYLDPLLEQFKDELGLEDDDIILVPALFEAPSGCSGYVAALIPAMVNLVSTTRDEQTDIFLADPFTRNSNSSEIGQQDDPFIDYVTSNFPESLELHFVDNWSVYHMQLGEVHCGTNVQRTGSDDWRRDASHLLD